MNKKKVFLAVLALILVCSMSVAGTLAYLTAKQDGQNAVVNTFVAAGGGNIIDPDDGPDGPVVPDPDPDNPGTITLQDGFFLVESVAVYENANYSLGTSKVITNTYDKVVPEMTIPKDPKLTANIENGVDVYVYVQVVDTTNGALQYSVDTNKWTALGTNYPGVYYYSTGIVTGAEDDEEGNAVVELNEVSVLTNNQVVAAKTLTGEELGSLTFYAYACQAGGFENAAAAFTACFGS